MPPDRLRSIVPMFGGGTHYIETLDAILEFVASHTPTTDGLVGWHRGTFERGVNYYERDRIQKLEVEGGDITAIVRGSRDYDISINIDDDTIRTVCSCPYDYAGDCKHIVAVLLAVEDRSSESTVDTVVR